MQALASQPWPAPGDDAPFARLSALADGELSAEQLDALLEQWARDPQMRRTWHAYQVSGDVLRSADGWSAAVDGGAFLAGIQRRLADEPVPLAPGPLLQPTEAVHPAGSPLRPERLARRRFGRRILGPSAVAAGFVAVAGMLVMLRGPEGPTAEPIQLSKDARTMPPGAVVVGGRVGEAAVPARAEQVPTGDEQRLLRDARVDHYLRAHRPDVGDSVGAETVGGRLQQVIRRP